VPGKLCCAGPSKRRRLNARERFCLVIRLLSPAQETHALSLAQAQDHPLQGEASSVRLPESAEYRRTLAREVRTVQVCIVPETVSDYETYQPAAASRLDSLDVTG